MEARYKRRVETIISLTGSIPAPRVRTGKRRSDALGLLRARAPWLGLREGKRCEDQNQCAAGLTCSAHFCVANQPSRNVRCFDDCSRVYEANRRNPRRRLVRDQCIPMWALPTAAYTNVSPMK